MKNVLVLIFASFAAIYFALGQGVAGSNPGFDFGVPMDPPYDGKKFPPLSLAEAYDMAVGRLGSTTNRFYCVSATCLEKTKSGWPAWTFSFSNTNGQTARVEVYFRKATFIDPASAEILGKQ
jgi:hypothetical protein